MAMEFAVRQQPTPALTTDDRPAETSRHDWVDGSVGLRRRIVFVINVDWFFCSHFLHLARQAKAEGYEVTVATNFERTGRYLADEGFDLVALKAERSGVHTVGVRGAVRTLSAYLRQHRDVIVHGFGLFGILVSTLAMRIAGQRRAVFTITGRGHTASGKDITSRAIRQGARLFCARVADGRSTRWLAENAQDVQKLRLSRAADAGRVAVVGGAGIDPAEFPALPLPPRPPLKCAIAARAVWSKGIDVVVEAVGRARARGVPVELTIAGGCDPGNPRSYSRDEMLEFGARPGITWLGHIDDVVEMWRSQHVAILASRGGEGVPKGLIEAAACGRPMITTRVAGCRELAEAAGGWVVPQDDPDALAETLAAVAAAPDLAERSAAARAAILNSYTQQSVWRDVSAWYDELGRQHP